MKKRGAIYSVAALMLCAAVYLNWYYTQDSDQAEAADKKDGKILGESILVDNVTGAEAGSDDAPVSGTEYFAQARLSRQQARDEAVSILSQTAQSADAGDEARAAASTGIQLLADNAVTESRIESLVIAKGYQDCVAFINDGGVNVIVAKTEAGLESADVARIRDIVLGETGAAADSIRVIEAE